MHTYGPNEFKKIKLLHHMFFTLIFIIEILVYTRNNVQKCLHLDPINCLCQSGTSHGDITCYEKYINTFLKKYLALYPYYIIKSFHNEIDYACTFLISLFNLIHF